MRESERTGAEYWQMISALIAIIIIAVLIWRLLIALYR